MGFFNRFKSDKAGKASTAKAAVKEASGKAEEKPKAAAPAAAKTEAAARETGDAYRVLIRPLVTEKTTTMAKDGKYAFEVSARTNKLAIKRAVKDLYGVDAVAVAVMSVYGKPVRGRFGRSRRSSWRKAFVTLKKGQSIDVFANA